MAHIPIPIYRSQVLMAIGTGIASLRDAVVKQEVTWLHHLSDSNPGKLSYHCNPKTHGSLKGKQREFQLRSIEVPQGESGDHNRPSAGYAQIGEVLHCGMSSGWLGKHGVRCLHACVWLQGGQGKRYKCREARGKRFRMNVCESAGTPAQEGMGVCICVYMCTSSMR